VLVSVSSPISPVVDHLADLALWEAELAADPQAAASSLARRLATVPDPRAVRGRRHPLVVLLVLAACATLVVGNDSVAAIWQWAAGTSQEVLQRIGARFDALTGRYVVPSERTFRRVLAALDADALDQAIGGYACDVARGVSPAPVLPVAAGPAEREQRRRAARAVTHPAPAGLLPAAAIDGKLLRGTVTATGPVFLVAAIAHRSGVVLGQRQVADKRGEGTVIEDLLGGLDVAGMVLTLDALHTTKKTARLITGKLHAHYLLILKANQPLALQAAQALLSGTDTEFADHTDIDVDRGHGVPNNAPCGSRPPITGCFPAPGRCSGYAATPVAWTANAPVKKSSTASSACPPTWPARPNSTTTPASTGASRTACTGPAMSRSAKTTPSSAPAPRRGLWPASAT
jgi:hypothetical protein